MNGSSTGRPEFLSIHNLPPLAHHVYSFLLSPASFIIISILPHFLILQLEQEATELGKKLVSSGRHEGSDEAAWLAFYTRPPLPSTWTAWMTSYLHSPLPAALLSLPRKQAQAETLRDLKHFHIAGRSLFILTISHHKKKAGLQALGSRHMLIMAFQCDPSQLCLMPCRGSCLHNIRSIPPRFSFVKPTETKHSRPQEEAIVLTISCL